MLSYGGTVDVYKRQERERERERERAQDKIRREKRKNRHSPGCVRRVSRKRLVTAAKSIVTHLCQFVCVGKYERETAGMSELRPLT